MALRKSKVGMKGEHKGGMIDKEHVWRHAKEKKKGRV